MSGDDPLDAMTARVAALDERLRQSLDWYPVAKKEFKDTIRSRGLWVLTLLFVTVFLVPIIGALFFASQFGLDQIPALQQTGMRVIISRFYLELVSTVFPLLAIFVGAAAITKERTSGSLKILLSLPFSRRDVIKGKVVGRCAVVAVPFVIGAALTAVAVVASKLTFKPEQYVLFMAFSLVLSLVMVAIAVAISGATRTTLRSVIANLTVYVYITFFWNALANGVGWILNEVLNVTGSLRWNIILFVKVLAPTQAYKSLVRSMLGRFSSSSSANALSAQQSARYRLFALRQKSEGQRAEICSDVIRGSFENQTVQTAFGNVTQKACLAGDQSLPVYFSDPAVVVYLVAWVALAVGVSYYFFDLADL